MVCKFLLRQRRREGPVERRDLPDIVLTFGIVSFGFYIFRCGGWDQISAGFINLWAYVVSFVMLWAALRLLNKCRALKIAAGVAVVIAAGVAAGLYAPRWYMLLKVWWMLPGALALLTEWRCRNMDYPLEHMCHRPWLRLVFYWACIFMIVISEPVDMTFIYFQF